MRKRDRRVRQLAQREIAPSRLPDTWPTNSTQAAEQPADRRRRFARQIGQLYAEGSTAARRRLLEVLLRPMSTFALIAVANGLFARIKACCAEWQGFQLRDEDIAMVDAQDVVALVEHALAGNLQTMAALTAAIRSTAELAPTAAAHALPLHVQSTGAPAANDPAKVSG